MHSSISWPVLHMWVNENLALTRESAARRISFFASQNVIHAKAVFLIRNRTAAVNVRQC